MKIIFLNKLGILNDVNLRKQTLKLYPFYVAEKNSSYKLRDAS